MLKLQTLLLTFFGATILAGCSTTSTTANNKPKVQTITVATGANTKPFTYTTKSGVLTGYDIAVLRAVDKALPQYKFQYKTTKFDSIFTGIDAGRYDIGANSISKDAERQQKYTFLAKPYGYDSTIIIKRKNDKSIRSISSLSGKKALVTSDGNASDLFLTAYNKKHPNNTIKLTYGDYTDLQVLQKIESGALDFKITSYFSFESAIKEFDIKDLTYVNLPVDQAKRISDPGVYFVFAQNTKGKQLAKIVNKQVTKLRQSGKLAVLAKKYTGRNISTANLK